MGVTLSTVGSYIGSFFTADTAAAATAETAATATTASTAAAAIPTVTVTGTAAGAGAAGTTAAAAAATAAGATVAQSSGSAAAPAPAPSRSIATTVSEAAAVASGASALYTLATGPGRLNVPPSPGVAGQDQTIANAEQAALQRRQAAGGLQSTIGTPGGAQGAILNPNTVSNRSLLGG